MKIDAVINAFGKPVQTALCVLSLLKHSGSRLGTIYLIVEKVKTRYDAIDSRCLEKLSDKIHVFIPQYWLGIDTLDASRLSDVEYRHSIRYQYAWEKTESDFLLIAHNDTHFKSDVVGDMADCIGDAVAVGEVGQCWNCPACRKHIVETLGVNGGMPCARERYSEFSLSFEDLDRMYRLVDERGEHYRHFLPTWSERIHELPWPLPECRVNEACCLINMKAAREVTAPIGAAPPLGAFVSGGCHNMDTGVGWFREVNIMGLRAKHMSLSRQIEHSCGHKALFIEKYYRESEKRAATIIRKEYPGFVKFCEKNSLPLF